MNSIAKRAISIQTESYPAVHKEICPLLEKHWEEIALDKEKVPLDPDWGRYAAMDNLGQLSIVTVRNQGRLVGYSVMIIQSGLHYRTCIEARMDLFWLDPAERGHWVGIRLFRAVEQELKRRGVKRIYCGSKLHKDVSRLFLALGYKPIERWFSKML